MEGGGGQLVPCMYVPNVFSVSKKEENDLHNPFFHIMNTSLYFLFMVLLGLNLG